ncbi:MAG: glycosyltransferase family 2 protein [Paludibacteraceae bacterium]|nr:glycosyltransferase family 2 protein [Paludibacteraceae bacterium]MBQ8705228.1 glycosyltransferase family 2 protein [Paludibacteraceae bacterium]
MRYSNSLSVVIPIYNDDEVIHELLRRLTAVVESIVSDYEIILVDDGSRDRSWEIMQEERAKRDYLRIARLSRNFGQQNSIAAGLSLTTKELIVLMDSDLQDRPEDIPVLIDALLADGEATMAIAQWEQRRDSRMKIAVSRLFQRVSNSITDIHTMPRLGIFRVMRKSVVEELRRFPEKTATAVSLLYYIGHKYVAVPLKRDARFAGKSGYNLSKMLSLTFARIFSFSMFPIRMVTYMGAFLCIGSMLAACGLIIYKLVGNVVTGWTSMMVLMLFLFGLNFAFLGILGEYIGRIFLETKQRPNFIIEQVI